MPIDLKGLYQAKSEELAQEKYALEFYDLPEKTQLVIYELAMELVNDTLISQAERKEV